MKLYEQNASASQLALPAVDTALLFAVFYLVDCSPVGRMLRHAGLASYPSLLFVGFVLSWGLLAHQHASLYQPGRLTPDGERLGYVLRLLVLHAGLVALGLLLLGSQLAPLPWLVPYLAAVYLGMLVAIPAGRFALACTLRSYRRYLVPRRYVIVGLSHHGLARHHTLSGHEACGSEFLGFFVEGHEQVPAHLRHLVRGTVATLKTFCRANRVDELYCALPPDRQVLRDDLAGYAAAHCLAFRIVPDCAGATGRKAGVPLPGRLLLRPMRRVLLALGRHQAAKRGFDIVFSSLVIVLMLSWVLPLLALLIKLDSRGPVLVTQLRPGGRSQLFLRTTWHDAARPGLQAPRFTRVGSYLRRYSLDELPQFFNVLLGHMSVIGLRSGGASQPESHSEETRTYARRPVLTPSLAG